jgi:hypothetical protein
VCVCVCVCERERERERECYSDLLPLFSGCSDHRELQLRLTSVIANEETPPVLPVRPTATRVLFRLSCRCCCNIRYYRFSLYPIRCTSSVAQMPFLLSLHFELLAVLHLLLNGFVVYVALQVTGCVQWCSTMICQAEMNGVLWCVADSRPDQAAHRVVQLLH